MPPNREWEARVIRKGEWQMMRAMRSQGLSISQIARRTGRDRKTVRKALASESWPADDGRRRVRRASKLDRFRDYIRARLQQAPISAVRMMEEIVPLGYEGKISILKAFVHEIKQQQRLQAVVRFETIPGEQAQVDWGKVDPAVLPEGEGPVYLFGMVLGYSRMRFVRFCRRMDLHTLMRCHLEAFRYFGGYPRRILYDNMKTVVLKPRRADAPAELNPHFADFAGFWGFEVDLCWPYRAQTKGKVERTIGYVKDNFLEGRRFVDLGQMNQQGLAWCDRVNGTRHGTTGEIPAEQLVKEGLQPLGQRTYDTARSSLRIVSRDCFVSYEGNRYEAPWRFAGKAVLVKDDDDGRLLIWDCDELLLVHRKTSGKGERIAVAGLNDELWRRVLGRRQQQARPRPTVATPALVLVGGSIALEPVQRRELSYYEQVAP